MSYKINITDSAENDIDSIIDYIVNELCNNSAALSLIASFDEKYEYLSENPYAYEESRHGTLRYRGYRRIVIDNYILLYLVDADNLIITIARVFYGKQDYQNCI